MRPLPFNFEINLKMNTKKKKKKVQCVQSKITKSGGKVSFEQQETEPAEFNGNNSAELSCAALTLKKSSNTDVLTSAVRPANHRLTNL